jgi:hypothetical protein
VTGGDRSRFGCASAKARCLRPSFRFAPNVAYRIDTKAGGRLVEHYKWPPERRRPKPAPAKKKVPRKRKA